MNEPTSYTGIDYAAGQLVNRNTETGVRYGVISSHSVNPDALEDIYQNGTDEDFENWKQAIHDGIRSALRDYLSERAIDRIIEHGLDDIGEDYEGTGDCTRYSYEADGYKLLIDSSGDLWVFESPYFTYAQFCSPCAPGACYLSNPLSEPVEANRCYCLGLEWFDDENPMPYTAHKL